MFALMRVASLPGLPRDVLRTFSVPTGRGGIRFASKDL